MLAPRTDEGKSISKIDSISGQPKPRRNAVNLQWYLALGLRSLYAWAQPSGSNSQRSL